MWAIVAWHLFIFGTPWGLLFKGALIRGGGHYFMIGDHFHSNFANFDGKNFHNTTFWGFLRSRNSNFASILVFELVKRT